MRTKVYPPETVRWRIRKIEEAHPGIQDYVGSSDCGCCDINEWLSAGGDYMVFDDYEFWRMILYGKRGA